MATTINQAFDLFMRDYVRLDSERAKIAISSKNNLISEIENFPTDGKFPLMYPEFSSIDYGSFSRKTKIRELDDIDLMIVLHAQGGWRDPIFGGYQISIPTTSNRQQDLCNTNTNILNSIKVVNRFKEYLSQVSAYEKADIKRNQEAATLKLKSYEWNYDIVPSFMTAPEHNGKTYFLIPDGKGNWKPTDPRIDQERTKRINGKQQVSVLDVVRIIKYWTKRPTMPTMKSYFLENLILNYYDGPFITSSTLIHEEISKIFALIYHQIHNPLNDPKGYQGDINHLSWTERNSIQERAKLDYNRAIEAIKLQTENKISDAIYKWREIFGNDFPTYS